MSSASNKFYFGLICLWSAALLVMAYRLYRRTKIDKFRYRLFELRDELVMLVANGELEEETIVFQTTANLLNMVIANVKRFTIRNFARGYLEAEQANEPKFDAYFEAVRAAPPHVQKVVATFFVTVAEIILENSRITRTVFWSATWLKRRLSFLDGITRPATFVAYRKSQSRASSLHAA